MRYLVAVALQFRTISFSLRYITYFLSLGVVFFVISLSIAEDMVGIIRSICENVRNEHRLQSIRMQLSTLIDFTNLKGYETLHLHSIHNISMNCKIVYSVFFSNVSRLLRYFIRIYRITLIVLFLDSITAICSAMLMIQLALVQVECFNLCKCSSN